MFNFSPYKFILVLFFGGVIFAVGANSAKAEILLPDGAGLYSEWQNTGGAGAGTFDEVKEYPAADDDTAYNKTVVALAKQSYSLANTVKTTGVIKNVKIWARAEAIGTADSVKLFLRVSGNDYFSSSTPVTTSYEYYSYQWDTNPQTTTAWSLAELNSLEAGFQLEGGGQEHRVTQMYVQVEYDSEINTAKYHVIQKIAPVTPGTVVSDNFSFYIADDLDEVKSAYIEIKGVAIPYNPLYLNVSVDDAAINPTSSPRLKTYTVNASGSITPIKIIYNTTDYFKTFVSGGGDYDRYLNFKITDPGSNVYVLNAKLIITYSWVKPPQVVGAYKTSGELISSTFDTGSGSGAAYNSIVWRGVKPVGTRVKFQMAGSNNQSGPFNFVGGDACDSNNWWEPENNTAQEIKCYSQLNNKRYFKYKIRLESNPPNYDNTPTVDDVVINFSP